MRVYGSKGGSSICSQNEGLGANVEIPVQWGADTNTANVSRENTFSKQEINLSIHLSLSNAVGPECGQTPISIRLFPCGCPFFQCS